MKPRNYVALAMRSRNGGTHRKPYKALRRTDKVKFLKNTLGL